MTSIATPAEAEPTHPNHDDANPAQEINELHKLGVIGTPRANSELLFEGGGEDLSKDLVEEVKASMSPKRKRSDSLNTQPGSDIDSDDVDDINDFLGVCTPVVCDGASAKKPKFDSDSESASSKEFWSGKGNDDDSEDDEFIDPLADVIDLTKSPKDQTMEGVKFCQEHLMKELKKLNPMHAPYGMQFQVGKDKRLDVQITDGTAEQFVISTMLYHKTQYGYFGNLDEEPTVYTTTTKKIGEVAANIAATVQGLKLHNAEV